MRDLLWTTLADLATSAKRRLTAHARNAERTRQLHDRICEVEAQLRALQVAPSYTLGRSELHVVSAKEVH